MFDNPNASEPAVRLHHSDLLTLLATYMHCEYNSVAEDQGLPIPLDDIVFASENGLYDYVTNELLERLDASSFPDFIKDAVRGNLVVFMSADHGPA